jgi:DnaK suppressor protein
MARTDALLRLHKSLTARRSELRKRLGIELDDLSRGKNLSTLGDTADAAFSHSGEEMASQLAELEARELRQVERALVRLKQGTYGKCEGCSARIPVERLNALPFSTLCIKCQREAEQDSMWYDDRGLTDWANVSDAGADDREVNLAQLESDFAK